MPSSSISSAIRERNLVFTLREPNMRPEIQEYVSYLRAASMRALKGLPPDGTTEIRLWSVFFKLSARNPELADRLRTAPATNGPDPDAAAALWATHRERAVESLRRFNQPKFPVPTPAPVQVPLAHEPWKRLKFDITRVYCVDPQDGFGRGYSDELTVSTIWAWKGDDGRQNDGINTSTFTDVAAGRTVHPSKADVTFVGAFKRSKTFPCKFSAMVVLVDVDNGNIVGDLHQLLTIVESEFRDPDIYDDTDEKPWYVVLFEALADWLIRGMADDVLGSFLSEVTLDDWRSMLSSGTKTSELKTATIQGSINGGSYRYLVDYKWTLS